MGRINPLIAIGIPTWGRVTLRWSRGYRHLGAPLGAMTMDITVENKPIAEARNQIMAQAIAQNCDYVFFLADDVIPPGDALLRLLQRMLDDPTLHLATGVYWSKGFPSYPYIWRGMQRGPYLDWKAGEWFPIDFAGCDCLLVRLSPEIKALGPEWFGTEWVWEPDQPEPDRAHATEDFFFYTKTRRAGLRLWCDSSVQCLHEDRQSGILFGLTTDMPQAGGLVRALPEPADGQVVQIAEIGAGRATPFFGAYGTCAVTRFDGDETIAPDVRCDLRHLPVPDESFDVVHARHVLEHFGRAEAPTVLAEWLRILRVGGELRLSVPNTLQAMKEIIAMEEDAAPGGGHVYPWWQLYGEQKDQRDFHGNGFTPRRLRRLIELTGLCDPIDVQEGDDQPGNGVLNLHVIATKARSRRPLALTEEWTAIERAEGFVLPGLAADPVTVSERHVTTAEIVAEYEGALSDSRG